VIWRNLQPSIACVSFIYASINTFTAAPHRNPPLPNIISQAKVSLTTCDDFGRTPLHDSFWTSTPNFKVCDLILERNPSLLFITDVRGCTPLCYARFEHHDRWQQYFLDRIRDNTSKTEGSETLGDASVDKTCSFFVAPDSVAASATKPVGSN